MRDIDHILADVEAARRGNDRGALLRLAEELDEDQAPLARANAFRSRGIACFLQGDFTAAQGHFSRALALFEEHGDPIGIGRALTGLGVSYFNGDNITLALECFHRALAVSIETGDRTVQLSVFNNLGFIYLGTGDTASALEHFYRTLAISEELDDRNSMAGSMCNIGVALSSIDDYPAALEQLYKALELASELDNKRWMANALHNIGNIFAYTQNYATALEYQEQAVVLYEEMADKKGIADTTTSIGWSYQNSGDYSTALEYQQRALALHREIGQTQASANNLCNIILILLEQRLYDDARTQLELMDTIQIDDPAMRIWREQCRAEIQVSDGDHDGSIATLQRALIEANTHGLRAKAADLHKALRDLAQQRNDLADYIEHNNAYTSITEEINGKETAAKFATQEAERRIERERQEHQKQIAVLHSTLPKHIADRVSRGEQVTDHYDNAAVLFLDVVGFTTHSGVLGAATVVALLQKIFTAFDLICAEHEVTKIKTIGDSYMAVAFPLESSSAEQRTANAAHAMMTSSFTWPSGDPVQFRIGLHSGPVVAGVLGTERMQYDVWGDTVNVASRMESSGEAGRIHVSEAFAKSLLLNDSMTNGSMTLLERGVTDIKGKGPMTTFWLEYAR